MSEAPSDSHPLEVDEVAAAIVDQAEAAIELHPSTATQPRTALRSFVAEAWARMSLGDLPAAVTMLTRARALAERQEFGDLDRADVLFRLGCCRLQQSEVANPTSLLTLALELCERSGRPCAELRARTLDWRARCYQRRRDWPAAHRDIELGLELAEGLDERVTAGLYPQASIVSEREGQWLLARCYGEQATGSARTSS